MSALNENVVALQWFTPGQRYCGSAGNPGAAGNYPPGASVLGRAGGKKDEATLYIEERSRPSLCLYTRIELGAWSKGCFPPFPASTLEIHGPFLSLFT